MLICLKNKTKQVILALSKLFQIQEGAPGEKQDPAAGGSKPKVKVKSIDLPIMANNIRQLDSDVLNNFVDYEVSAPDGLWKS